MKLEIYFSRNFSMLVTILVGKFFRCWFCMLNRFKFRLVKLFLRECIFCMTGPTKPWSWPLRYAQNRRNTWGYYQRPASSRLNQPLLPSWNFFRGKEGGNDNGITGATIILFWTVKLLTFYQTQWHSKGDIYIKWGLQLSDVPACVESSEADSKVEWVEC